MKRLATSQISNLVDGTASSSSFTILKDQRPNNIRKSKPELSTDETLNISRRHDTQSDVSEDDADKPVPRKKWKVSIIHSYADKLSNVEYKCTMCLRVMNLYLIS
ncbi:unnamed protein product [Didymodactylos carnosus]|uniref:Uncharacterized protein n=1 Tax=Didymodactylos carnosus TaxID=1234261 RepID=A0A8S2L9S8_9BILA|nr:unnamed protein product [Didymodactylos carnosus]CAF3892247.1 unnamed protein product [Didymodactylos carnosus]